MKTHGLLPIVTPDFFHSPTLAVLMNASGKVMSAAMQSLVSGLHTDRMSSIMESLRYGVSMKICVCPEAADVFSMLFSFERRSSRFAGR